MSGYLTPATRNAAHDVAMIAALALIQRDGDAGAAVAQLEGMRATHTDELQVEVIQIAQEAINSAADLNELPEGRS